MYVKYSSSFYNENGERIRFNGNSPDIFKNCAEKSNWNNEIYFYPSLKEEPVWLWVIGRERAWDQKCFDKTIYMNRLVLHFCTGGKGEYNGKPIKKGSCFIIWPYLAASLRSDEEDPLEFYWIILRGEQLETFAKNHRLSPSNLIFDTDYTNDVINILDVAFKADYSGLNIYEYTTGLISMVLSYVQATRDKDHLYDIATYSHNYVKAAKNIMDRKDYGISVSELSTILGLTPKHFSRVFRQTTGETPKQYMTRKRMNIAMSLLRRGVPPNEVAIMVKYTDYASFYRAFLKIYGTSPKEFAENENK